MPACSNSPFWYISMTMSAPDNMTGICYQKSLVSHNIG
jgi:hypothetical protein